VKDLATFKAQFPNVLANKPFVPAKSNRPLTGPNDKYIFISYWMCGRTALAAIQYWVLYKTIQ